MEVLLADAATPADFAAARTQMALSLGWHIVVACFGVAMPAMTLFAEWRSLHTGDPAYGLLARRWARAMGVLFAVGAVSGTILSFEMGLLWPGLMDRFGQVIGLPFTLEGFAFFVEAIFIGIYLYGWDRMSPRAHLLSGIPVLLAGAAGTFFVVSANAWMNQPRGFDLESGEVVGVDPWAAMFNPATGPQSVHMLVAAFMVTGFLTASVYAVGMLRGRRERYHRLGFLIPFTVAAALAPVQVVVGDWAARFVAEFQPVKFAAMEGQFPSERGAPLHLGGVVIDGQMRYAVEIPSGLSLLGFGDPNAEVMGLDEVAEADRPPVNVVHLSFQAMVGAGFAMVALAGWFAVAWWRRRRPPDGRWFLRAATLCGPAAVLALEAGWVTTEVGRQPWVVYGVQRTSEAVNPAPGLTAGLVVIVAVYTLLTAATVYVLRRLARDGREPLAPQEADRERSAAP
jgi:cytochrome d ubiquinol oxidase subunit I